ncbi:hypothetical protein PoB_005534400 [Plakobranchus ocellatus]|uniref:RanBP2-type domain-containing protein n=1 Tax=Plakobranchus ocellatus TaxID=259542 RepID=A0AAV4CCH4_9GAST|nr:hypothetical protein PoB_005534400 [Plakobranchus ocellatus]
MGDPAGKGNPSTTKATNPDNGGPIIEESQESEEYQQDLKVVIGTAFGVIVVVGLIALGLLLYRLYRARSNTLSRNQNDDLNLLERNLSLGEREEGITIMADSSEKSEDSDELHTGHFHHPCDMLETETGMLLQATLEQAKAFFQENPTWMEEQMERASLPASHSQVSPSAGFFFNRGKGKKWRRKRRHHRHSPDKESYRGAWRKAKSCEGRVSVKEPLLSLPGQGNAEEHCLAGSPSLLSPMTLQQKLSLNGFGFSEGGMQRGNQYFSHSSDQDVNVVSNKEGINKRNTLPRSGKKKAHSRDSLENEDSSGFAVDSPPPNGMFHSRQNSLPSSLASSRTPAISDVFDADGTVTSKAGAAPGSPSSGLLPVAKLSCLSKSADSFALTRDFRQWHPLDNDTVRCLYCNSTQFERGCSKCRPEQYGRLKGNQNHDIDPGFSSSAEGLPALKHNNSKSTSQSQTTILQAEVHQEWRAEQDLSCLSPSGGRVWNSLPQNSALTHEQIQTSAPVTQPYPPFVDYWDVKKTANLPRSNPYTNCGNKVVSPGMKRWVSGIVESPRRQHYTTNFKNFSSSINRPANVHQSHHSITRTSSVSSNDDSASVSSTGSLSDGDSLERDLRSIQKISSFHDFVVSSPFVDSHKVTFSYPEPALSLSRPLSLLPSAPCLSSDQSQKV